MKAPAGAPEDSRPGPQRALGDVMTVESLIRAATEHLRPALRRRRLGLRGRDPERSADGRPAARRARSGARDALLVAEQHGRFQVEGIADRSLARWRQAEDARHAPLAWAPIVGRPEDKAPLGGLLQRAGIDRGRSPTRSSRTGMTAI
jgi:hypothetical protein